MMFFLWIGVGIVVSIISVIALLTVCVVKWPPFAGVVLALAAFAGNAQACNRCGLFGNRCHLQQSYVSYAQPVVQAAPTNASTNFVFNNTFPTPYLLSGQQGQSVYGYSLASAPYQLDANLFMDRAARFTELALQNSDDANKAFAANTAQAMALNDSSDRRTKNTLLALSAIQANSASGSTPQQTFSFRATVGSNGRLSVERIESEVPPPQQPNATGNFRSSGVGALTVCARCHDGAGRDGAPPGLVLDGSQQISDAQYDACLAKLKSGEMPSPAKSQPLSPSNQIDVTAALCELRRGPLIKLE